MCSCSLCQGNYSIGAISFPFLKDTRPRECRHRLQICDSVSLNRPARAESGRQVTTVLAVSSKVRESANESTQYISNTYRYGI